MMKSAKGGAGRLAEHTLRHLESELEAKSPGALQLIKKHLSQRCCRAPAPALVSGCWMLPSLKSVPSRPLATRSCRFDSFKRSLGEALKLNLDGTEVRELKSRMSRKLSETGEFRESMGRHLSWAPHASDHQLRAILHDIISAMATASGRKLRWLEKKDTGHRSSVSVLWRRLMGCDVYEVTCEPKPPPTLRLYCHGIQNEDYRTYLIINLDENEVELDFGMSRWYVAVWIVQGESLASQLILMLIECKVTFHI